MKKLLGRLGVYSVMFLGLCLVWSVFSYLVNMFNFGLDNQIYSYAIRPSFDFKFSFSFMIITLFIAEIIFQIKKTVDKNQ